MRLHRFIVHADLHRSPLTLQDAELCHQLLKVLRLSAGDRLILVDGKGVQAEGTITELHPDHVRITLDTAVAVDTEPARSVTLCCSILKRENFELVVQKATELGVSRIIPIIAERTVKTGLKMERLKAIAKEATEQSGRGVVPDISEPMSLTDALALPGHKLFFHTGTQAHPALSSDPALLFIGPEGGWSDRDVAAAVSAGCQVCSLGKRTLRGETAAIVACYQAVA